MTLISHNVQVDAPPDRVWQILSDFGGVAAYNPNVLSARSTSDANGGVGATRHCDLAPGGVSIEERILEWNEGESYTLEIYDGVKAPPFETAQATFSVSPRAAGGTEVSAKLAYTLRFGLIGRLMDRFMVRPRFEPAFRATLAGLKHYAEQGEAVDGRTTLDPAALKAA